MILSANAILYIALTVALAGASGGLVLFNFPKGARTVTLFGGGFLSGIAVFGVLPELAGRTGWVRGLPAFGTGYVLMWFLDRYLHRTREESGDRGLVVPLLFAAWVHAFIDGWGLAAAVSATNAAIRLSFPLAITLHKAPEGLALGAIFLSTAGSRKAALALCFLAESATVIGGWTAVALIPRLGTEWTNYPLALAGGCFLYLGAHGVHSEWKRNGLGFALWPAVAGLAGAAVIQSGIAANLP